MCRHSYVQYIGILKTERCRILRITGHNSTNQKQALQFNNTNHDSIFIKLPYIDNKYEHKVRRELKKLDTSIKPVFQNGSLINYNSPELIRIFFSCIWRSVT